MNDPGDRPRWGRFLIVVMVVLGMAPIMNSEIGLEVKTAAVGCVLGLATYRWVWEGR